MFSVNLAESSAEFRISSSYYTSFLNSTVSGPFSVIVDVGSTPPPPLVGGYSFYVCRTESLDAFPAYGKLGDETDGIYFLMDPATTRSMGRREFSGYAGSLVRPIISGAASNIFKMQPLDLEFWEYSALGSFVGGDRFCCVVPAGVTPSLSSKIILCLVPPFGTTTFTFVPSPPVPYPGALRKLGDYNAFDSFTSLAPTNFRTTGLIYFLDAADL